MIGPPPMLSPEETVKVAFAQHRARRIGRIGQEHQPRARGHGGQDRVHVDHAVTLLHLDRGCPGGMGQDRIHGKAVFRGDDLIPRPGIGLRDELQHLVRTDTANQAVGVQAVNRADGPAQGAVVGVGIAVQLPRRRRKGRLRAGRGAIGVLVRGQFQHIVAPGQRALAADVKRDVQDARLRADAVGHGGPRGVRPAY